MFSNNSENTLLSSSDISHSIRSLSDRKLHDGYRLVNKIENTKEKILIGSNQVSCDLSIIYNVFINQFFSTSS